MSERPRYWAAAGCSLLHFLAAAGRLFAPLGAFSVSVFSTYPAEFGVGLKNSFAKFNVGHVSHLFCSVFFFIGVTLAHLSAPRFSRVFQSSSACLIFLPSRVPDFIPVSNFTTCVVQHWRGSNRLIRASHLFSSSASARAKLITPYVSRIQVVHAIYFSQSSLAVTPPFLHHPARLPDRFHFGTQSEVFLVVLAISVQSVVRRPLSTVPQFGSRVDHISAVR